MKSNLITSVRFVQNELLQMEVFVTTEHVSKMFLLFRYYPDELTFSEEELKGSSLEEAMRLFHEKDTAYLRS